MQEWGDDEISTWRTFRSVLFLHSHTGKLNRLKYILGVLAQNCDSYLDEIQSRLRRNCETNVSLSTIWRALNRAGYSLKKVLEFYYD
jgi:transposase